MTMHERILTPNQVVQPRAHGLPTSGVPTQDVRVLLGAAASGGRGGVIATVEVPGHEPPCHRHLVADTLLYVLAGELTLYRDGDWIAARAGSVLWVPRGTVYTFAVMSAHADLLSLFLPAGFEQFYVDLGPAPWHDVERAIGTAARYNCEITGPHPHPQLRTPRDQPPTPSTALRRQAEDGQTV
jgi:quercetin dioxygenase-like cupin family protein